MTRIKGSVALCSAETSAETPGGALCFAGHDTAKLAEKYGTPLYLMDEGRIRDNCRMYLHAFKDAFGERGKVLYASKAGVLQAHV